MPARLSPTHPRTHPPRSPQVLLIENDVNTNPFTPAVHACVPPLPWAVGPAELEDPRRCGPCKSPPCPQTLLPRHCICTVSVTQVPPVASCSYHHGRCLACRRVCWHGTWRQACQQRTCSQPPVGRRLLRCAWHEGRCCGALPRRADLRHLPICSVDPPGCKDIDDALHVRPLPNGNYELGACAEAGARLGRR